MKIEKQQRINSEAWSQPFSYYTQDVFIIFIVLV